MKNVIEMLERHPAVRFGLPVVTVMGCTLLFLFGSSFFGSTYTYIAIGVLLLLTGYFCGWRVWGVVVTLSLALILTAGPYMVVPRVQWAGSAGTSPLLYHSPEDPGPAQLRAEYGLDDVIRGVEDSLSGWRSWRGRSTAGGVTRARTCLRRQVPW